MPLDTWLLVTARALLLLPRNVEHRGLLYGIGKLLCDHADFQQSLCYYGRCLALEERDLGCEHPDVAATQTGMAVALGRQGNSTEALALLTSALSKFKGLYGEVHLDVAATQSGIGDVHRLQGRFDVALENYALALSTRVRLLDDHLDYDHLDLARSQHNVAEMYRAAGRNPEALAMLTMAMQTYEKVLGKDHRAVADACYNLGALQMSEGDAASAVGFFSRCWAIYKIVYGERHAETRGAKRKLDGAARKVHWHLKRAKR
jgi:tetratricopeptide (TPR) repeat protein